MADKLVSQPETDLTERYDLEPSANWRLLEEEERWRLCSTKRCPNAAVMVLLRRRPGPRGSTWRWFCCGEHSYGRVIIDGRIYFDREHWARSQA